MVKHYPVCVRPKHHLRTLLCFALLILLFCLAASDLDAAMSAGEVDDAMTRGYTAIKAGDFEAAKVIFASVVQDAASSPRAPEAMLTLGNLRLKTDSTTATSTYSSLVNLYPDTSQAGTAHYRLGLLGMRTKHLHDARDAFLSAAGNKNISDLDRGQASLQAGFVDIMKYLADEFWDRADDGVPYLVKPEADDRNGFLESARAQFEATEEQFARSKDPTIAAVAAAALGEIYLLSGKPAFAEVAYRRVLDAYGSVPDRLVTLARYGLGQALYGQKNLDGALVEFDEALSKFTPGSLPISMIGFQVAPKSAVGDMHAWKVLSLYGLKRFDDALSAAREARTEMEKDSELRDRAVGMDIWEGVILCQTDRKAEGLTILQSVIDEHPNTPYADRARSLIAQFEEGVN